MIQDIIDSGNTATSTLAFYLLLKTAFKNSIFYNATINSIAKRVGVSHYLASKLIKKMIDKEWANWNHSGHLCLRSLKYIDENPKKSFTDFTINTDMSLNEVIDVLRATTIQCDYNKQMHVYHVRSYRDKTHSSVSAFKSWKKKMKLIESTPELNVSKAFTSDRRIANQTNLSLSSANRLRKRLEESGVIYTSPRRKILKKNCFDYFPIQITKEGLIKREGNDIVLLQGKFINKILLK